MKKKFCFVILFVSFAATTYSQSKLKGIIKDEKGAAIEAASVSVKGTSVFRVADAKGAFTIPAPNTLPFTLTVTSVGFAPAEAEITELKDSVIP